MKNTAYRGNQGIYFLKVSGDAVSCKYFLNEFVRIAKTDIAIVM
jgi:hypothetical protein